MVHHIVLDESELENFQEGGGLEKDTINTRKKIYTNFETFMQSKGSKDIGVMFETAEGCQKFTDLLGEYFITMRVKKKDGSILMPKRGYAEKIRSNLKMSILERFKLDITDRAKFPLAEMRWRSFTGELVKNNRGETEHKQELPAGTMEAILKLLADAKAALEARGSPEYDECLQKIPVEWRHKLNSLVQNGAQMILTLYEVRRSKEGLEFLKKKDLQVMEDDVWQFKYMR